MVQGLYVLPNWKRWSFSLAPNGLGIKEGGECLVGGFKKAVSSLDAYKPKDTQFAPLYFIPC